MVTSRLHKERLTGLYLVEKLLPLPVANDAFKADVVAPLVAGLLSMEVESNPNVRLKTARLMGDLLAFFTDEAAKTVLRPALTLALGDSDRDVRYFSRRALGLP